MNSKISVIIPVLNEEKTLRKTLERISLTNDEELIIVDGGSTDGTFNIAKEYTQNIYRTKKGRGRQMNYGAMNATGELFLFLHADCVLPRGAFEKIRALLSHDFVSAGAFDLAIDHSSMCYRIIEKGANLRSRLTSIPYGDQALFMRKKLFDKIGGYPVLSLMEDIGIAQKLKKIGRICFLREKIMTSPRRWSEEGPLYTTIRDWFLAISYGLFRVSPEKLSAYYRDIR